MFEAQVYGITFVGETEDAVRDLVFEYEIEDGDVLTEEGFMCDIVEVKEI